jgi:hypothetical protein
MLAWQARRNPDLARQEIERQPNFMLASYMPSGT